MARDAMIFDKASLVTSRFQTAQTHIRVCESNRFGPCELKLWLAAAE